MLAARTFREPGAERESAGAGKRLGKEIYVASEASATPLPSYAPLDRDDLHPDPALSFEHDLRANAFRVCREGKPGSTFPDHALSNFSPGKRVPLPWTPRNEVLSSADFPLPSGLRRHSLHRRIATKHLISGGFSS
jgi:hypothetical protein